MSYWSLTALFKWAGHHPFATLFVSIIALLILVMGPQRLLGRSPVRFYHADRSLTLPLKFGQKTTVSDLAKSITPPCDLNPLLFNGHIHTIKTLARGRGAEIHYKRRIFEQEDEPYAGTFAVDFVTKPNKHAERDSRLPPRTTYFTEPEFSALPGDDTKPMLVVLPGLNGGSHEQYLRAFLEPLVASERYPDRGGWEACVIMSRGCGRSGITSPMLYSAKATWDVRQTVRWLRQAFPNRPLFGVGFSLGACMMVNYLGEEGEACPLQAAVVISATWEIQACSLALRRTWFEREVYSQGLGHFMKKTAERHHEVMSKNPMFDMNQMRSAKYMFEFDRTVHGITFGYTTVGAYYRDASPIDATVAIRIPVLAIHSIDDPVCPSELLPFEEVKVTPFVTLCTSNLGGHLGWYQSNGDRWYVNTVGQSFRVV